MSLYAISDLHLPLGIDKPMDIFGEKWQGYVNKIEENWQEHVKEDDIVVLPGDFSWATYLEQASRDFEFLHKLNGTKILIKGNHDYYWTTKRKLDEYREKFGFHDMHFLNNNAYFYNDTAICGTRGWLCPSSTDKFTDEDMKIYLREIQRLELSIQSALSNNPSEIIAFMHYPPALDSGFVDVLKKYGVKDCIYGHLHAHAHALALEGVYNEVNFKLVSGDYIMFNPVKIRE